MAMYLLLKKIQVHNANAMSSPLTVGFPAMTAWLGAVHALERRLGAEGIPDVHFSGVAVASHACDVQLHRGSQFDHYSIIGTANPLKKKDGKYERPPLIEEARCHLCVSLLIRVQGIDSVNKEQLEKKVVALLWRMKLAGGDIEKIGKVEIVQASEEKDEHRLLCRLMPSYVLVERRNLMLENEEGRDMLDTLLAMLAVEYEAQDDGNDLKWKGKRRVKGWLVPIAVGFKAITGKVKAEHQRSLDYDHYFVEPIVTLGEFRMPCHFQSIDEILWEYHTDLAQGLYLCRNQNIFQIA